MKRSETLYLLRTDPRLSPEKTLCYLIRRLVGKSQNDHLFQRHMSLQMQIQYLLDQHRGLSASHIGVDHTGQTVVQHGCSLILIQLYLPSIPFRHLSPRFFSS